MRRTLPLLLIIAAALAGGCGSCFGPFPDGNSANGWFAVGPRVSIAAGATLDVVILDAHEGRSILTATEVGQATSTNPEIFEVSGAVANEVELFGRAAGEATLEFDALTEGERRDDSITYSVVEPLTFAMRLDCAGGNVVRGRPAAIAYSFGPRSFGRGLYPITVDPPEAATINTDLSSSSFLVLDISETAPETITVSVDPESGMTGSSVVLTPIDETPVTDITVRVPLSIDTREPEPLGGLAVTATVEGGTEVCTVYPLQFTTSDACGIWFDSQVTTSRAAFASEIALLALSDGICTLRVALDLLTSIIEKTLSVEVIAPRPPSSGGGGGGGSDFDFD